MISSSVEVENIKIHIGESHLLALTAARSYLQSKLLMSLIRVVSVNVTPQQLQNQFSCWATVCTLHKFCKSKAVAKNKNNRMAVMTAPALHFCCCCSGVSLCCHCVRIARFTCRAAATAACNMIALRNTHVHVCLVCVPLHVCAFTLLQDCFDQAANAFKLHYAACCSCIAPPVACYIRVMSYE